MNIEELKPYIVGFLIGAIIIGGGVYILMDRKLRAEQKKVEIAEDLIDATIKQMTQPPAPPSI